MKGRIFWMTDPEADAITSPFVRQPHYNDLENRIRDLEAALRAVKLRMHYICHPAEAMWSPNGKPIPDWRKEIQLVEAALSGARTADETKGDEHG